MSGVSGMSGMSGIGMQPQLGSLTPLIAGDPARVGRYELIGRLGVGGMGTVYLGRNDDRVVAVKVIRPELALDSSFRARFRDEARVARGVAAFCTAQVLDADPDADPPYIVTEYIDGVPLDHVVQTKGPLPSSTLHGVAVGVATALAAIHAVGLVHRDLKPSNVLLSLSGPRVIDFGIARSLTAPGGHTLAGVIVGTPGWMAPEQLLGEPATPAADVFAWGCLVVFAATGRGPWGEGTPTTVAHAVLHQPPDLSGVEGPLHSLIEAALRSDVRRRPAARELVLSQLGSAVASDPSTAVTHLLERTWTPPPGQHRGPATGTGPPTEAEPQPTRIVTERGDARVAAGAEPDQVKTEPVRAGAPTERMDSTAWREWWSPPQDGWGPPQSPPKEPKKPKQPKQPKQQAQPAPATPPSPPSQQARAPLPFPAQPHAQPPAQPSPQRPPQRPLQPPMPQWAPPPYASHQQPPRQPVAQFPPWSPNQGPQQSWFPPTGQPPPPMQPGGQVAPYVPPKPPKRRRQRLRWVLFWLILLFLLMLAAQSKEKAQALAVPAGCSATASSTVADGASGVRVDRATVLPTITPRSSALNAAANRESLTGRR